MAQRLSHLELQQKLTITGDTERVLLFMFIFLTVYSNVLFNWTYGT